MSVFDRPSWLSGHAKKHSLEDIQAMQPRTCKCGAKLMPNQNVECEMCFRKTLGSKPPEDK
jgi:hypothetical protein